MLNKSNGNMYPGVVTWNPLAGECLHKCSYCSTHALMRYPVLQTKYSGPLRLDEKAMGTNLREGRTVFVVAQNDLFAEGVPNDSIRKILKLCRKYDNTYLFQSKNPKGFIPFLNDFPKKTILCTTIETNRFYPEMGNTPFPLQRALAMNQIITYPKYVTIEPIMDFDLDILSRYIRMCNPKQVNIGADSKGHHLPEPSREKLLALIDELKRFTVIDQKRNLDRLLKTDNKT